MLAWALMLWGCQAPDTAPGPAARPTGDTGTQSMAVVVPEITPASGDLEVLVAESVDGFALDGTTGLLTHTGDLHTLDPFGAVDVALRGWGPLHGGTPWAGAMLLQSESTLQVWDGIDVQPTPLDDWLTPPVTTWLPDGAALWVHDAAGVHLWDDGLLYGVSVGDAPVTHPALAQIDAAPVLWVAQGADLWALERRGDGLAVVDHYGADAAVDSVGAGSDGTVWAVSAGTVLHRTADGAWTQFLPENPVLRVLSHPQAAPVWLYADPAWYRVDAAGWQQVDATPPDAELSAVDAVGRLWAAGDSLSRVSVGRPLVLVGLPEDGVLGRQSTIDLLATVPAEVTGMAAEWLSAGGGDPVPLEVDGDQVVLDPEVLEDGLWTLKATATYADDTSTTSATLAVGTDYEPGWQTDIAPIHESNCAVCHEAGSETLLDGAQTWQDHIDNVLANVRSGAMPLGGPPLSDADVVRIEAWRAADFPP